MLQLATVLLLQAGASTDSITIADALRYARQRRSEVAAAGAQVDEARALRRLATRPPNPTVELTTVNGDDSRRVGVSQPLAPLGRIRFDMAAATAQLTAMRDDSTQRVANLERDVTRAFYGAVAARTRVRLLGELARLADSLGTLAARRADAGDISQLDREQFALESTRAHLQLSRAREDAAARTAALVRQLAWQQPGPPVPVGALDATFTPSDTAMVAAGAVPAVRRARASAAAAARARDALAWARLPMPGLVVQHDWSRVPGFVNLTRVGVSVPIPLFSVGNEALGAATARARQAAAEATEVELDVERSLAATRVRVAEAGRRARLASDSLLTGAVRLREGAIRLYDAGRTSVLQVLEALRTERDAQLATVDELLAYHEARADLLALLGRTSSFDARRDP